MIIVVEDDFFIKHHVVNVIFRALVISLFEAIQDAIGNIGPMLLIVSLPMCLAV